MPTIHTPRLSQFAEAPADTFRVELSLDGRDAARAGFQFKLSEQDQEDLRWYLEDYLQCPLDPAPKIAARIEQRLTEVGAELFHKVFEADPRAATWRCKSYGKYRCCGFGTKWSRLRAFLRGLNRRAVLHG
jgi:hypothetical protein